MAIMTKAGNQGFTSTKNGIVSKDDELIILLGTIDETIASIVFAQALSKEEAFKQLIPPLSLIASIVAGYQSEFPKRYLAELEFKLQSNISDFIYPFDDPSKASINLARTTVRKLERMLVSYQNSKELPPEIIPYINRLSNYLHFFQI